MNAQTSQQMDKAAVIHFGSHSTVAGFSNRELPQCVSPSAYLRTVGGDTIFGLYPLLQATEGDLYVLFDNRGVPTDWEMLEKFLRWIYSTQLRVDTTEVALCVTVPPDLSPAVKNQFHELALCRLGVPVFQLISEPLAVTFSLGKTTALVVDVGAAKATVTPVVDGGVVKNGIMRSRFAGDFLDYQLQQAVEGVDDSQGSLHQWQQSRTWVYDFKNTMLQVSPMRLSEVEKQLQQSMGIIPIPIEGKKNFVLRREKVITWELKQCYHIAEGLFDPSIVSQEFDRADGLGEIVGKAVKKCAASVTSNGTTGGGSAAGGGGISSVSAAATAAAMGPTSTATPEQIHAALLTNVVLIGGTSLLQGLEQRLVYELNLQFPQYKLLTYATPVYIDRQLQSWQGGVNMCHLPYWKLGSWMSKQEYLDSLEK
ncbi:HEL045Cp [Eremothecium sinecaudum]|uniref:HEL045Cp n=1 Tax=Eremothecium sinecaudum TaxID=45286 RepID=A0A0X8HTK6_9SACH|nr:HEL045Cp [Eremothecium sinecaudum]AMD21235.1 HEL045Cp [Eremothecium sinecaudum]